MVPSRLFTKQSGGWQFVSGTPSAWASACWPTSLGAVTPLPVDLEDRRY